ncbi:MAG: efflux RND transporter periplasmic adaptor subunit [Halomonadaceae bacterium]|nr:MAG: efflux RND transporter periplasmic adaptor subunit [Halomonadaceae bacterium]
MPRLFLPLLLAPLLLLGCGDGGDSRQQEQAEAVPFVRMAPVLADEAGVLSLSGEVRARRESPLSFQVGGQIVERLVDAGETVSRGQALLLLNNRDLQENLNAARADAAAAQASLALAQSNLERDQRLFTEQHLSRQALDRSELQDKEAEARLEAAQARVTLADNALGYGQLSAPADGVLLSVTGQPGQVVNAGEPVALLAHEARQEVEVFFPRQVAPPAQGLLHAGGEQPLSLTLREASAALDDQSRTRRARYRVEEGTGEDSPLVLGSILRTEFSLVQPGDAVLLKVPLSALDERGEGPLVWQVVQGQTQPLPVEVVSLGHRFARIHGDLAPGDAVVALGTHLLRPGMAVRVHD